MLGSIHPGDRLFRPRLLKLEMCGGISDPRMGPYPPRAVLALGTPGWGLPNVRSGTQPGDRLFRPGVLELEMYGGISDPSMGPYPPRVALALRTPGWGFHTVRSGIDPRDHSPCSRLLELQMYEKIYDPRMGLYPLWVGAGSCWLYGWNSPPSVPTFQKEPAASGMNLANG